MLARAKSALRSAAVLLIAMAIALTAMPASPPASAAEEILLGALLPLTGPAAPTGAAEQRGVQFAVARANSKGGVRGRQVKVFYEDSQGKPDQGMLSFNRLVDLHRVQVTLTAFSSVTLAIAPLGTRKKILIINPAAQSSDLDGASPFLLNTIPTVRDEARMLAKFVVEKLKLKTTTIIYENASAGVTGKDDFKQAFLALGGKVLSEEPTEFGQTNYRPTLLKAAATKPDFVYISMTQGWVPFAEQVGQIPNFPLGVGPTFMSPLFGYPSTVGWYASRVKSEISPDLQAEYAKMFPGVVSQSEVQAGVMGFFEREYFNSTNITLRAIDKVLGEAGELTGEAVRKAIYDIGTFEGVDRITFEKDKNTAVRGIEVYRFDKDKKTPME